MDKLLLIYNPIAGREQTRKDLSLIVEEFAKAGFMTTVMPTAKSGDVTEFILNYSKDFDLIVSCGGDGTMNEMANAIVKLDYIPKCGYIPAGTVNDFANSLRIPMKMPEAARMIGMQKFFDCDLCSFNGRAYTYVAGFGLFTNVSYTTPQDTKNILGKMAYAIEGVKRFSEYEPVHMKVESVDKVVEDDFILGLISNSEYIAGYDAYNKKNIKMDDGVFEVFFIKEINNPLEAQDVLNALLTKELHSDNIVRFQTDKVKITSSTPVQWTLDGEDGGTHTDVEIVTLRKALKIAVPQGNLSVALSSTNDEFLPL